ncbi:MAG: undecaprenyl/decaprenyl-phosphate alpha-N-acetylglucosaminyl 1-phosphate transferase [Bacillota bacterium]|nr:MAG: undecaprenyl/decaprenyl-phosphate alpha-N-acetylglucosaminyl 1-phosphate transferase [Bacillota bacterium]
MLLPLLTFSLAFIVTYGLTPLVGKLARRVGAVAIPVDRSVHTHPVPHLGGMAIFASFALTVVLVEGWPDDRTLTILGCGFLALALGAVDDLKDISPTSKLLGQILVASLVVGLGVRVHFISNPFTGGIVYLGDWSYLLSVLWVVAVMNVVNLADGLDGLAAGICAIAALAALFVAARTGVTTTSVVVSAAALAGATAGFLPHNFNPAKIFMGDTGSMFLGFALAAISVEGALKQTTTVALLVPMIALALPITDTALAIVRRLRAKRSIGQADKGHIHHRLLDIGLSQRKAVLLMWGVTAWMALSAVILSEVREGVGFIVVACLAGLGPLAFLGLLTTGSIASSGQGKNLPK